MKRREVLKAIIGSAAGWPLVAVAQQPATTVIGYLGLTSAKADAYLLAPFRKALSEAGFDEGRNVTIEYRFAERDVSRLPALGLRTRSPERFGYLHRHHSLGPCYKSGDLNHSCRICDRR